MNDGQIETRIQYSCSCGNVQESLVDLVKDPPKCECGKYKAKLVIRRRRCEQPAKEKEIA